VLNARRLCNDNRISQNKRLKRLFAGAKDHYKSATAFAA